VRCLCGSTAKHVPSVIAYFQKIHQQLNFGVQGWSTCIIISFTVMWTRVPGLFNDKLISVITRSTSNKISTIPVVYSDSQELPGELHHSGDQPLTLFN